MIASTELSQKKNIASHYYVNSFHEAGCLVVCKFLAYDLILECPCRCGTLEGSLHATIFLLICIEVKFNKMMYIFWKKFLNININFSQEV